MATGIRTVAVVGTGVIGAGWASLFLATGRKVLLSDPAPGAREKFGRFLQDVWPTFKPIGLENEASKMNYEFLDAMHPRLIEADFIQEIKNGPERIDIKRQIIAELDAHARPDVVIASSSSGMPSSRFVQECKYNPARVLIGHPFNPSHLMPLVEVVPHPKTSEDSITTALGFYKSLGKKPILVSQETPGFVANRLQAAVNNEAYSLVSRNIVSARDLDLALTNGPGVRWALNGPFETNAFGGGGGMKGFVNRLEHLGPSIRDWEDDIAKHRFDWNDASLDALKRSVEEHLGPIESAEAKKVRDEKLLGLLALKL